MALWRFAMHRGSIDRQIIDVLVIVVVKQLSASPRQRVAGIADGIEAPVGVRNSAVAFRLSMAFSRDVSGMAEVRLSLAHVRHKSPVLPQ